MSLIPPSFRASPPSAFPEALKAPISELKPGGECRRNLKHALHSTLGLKMEILSAI